MENTGRRNIKVIIGANAGDEGKGNVTNLFCMTEEPVLGILTNGGPQRGHTAWKDGKSHVLQKLRGGTDGTVQFLPLLRQRAAERNNFDLPVKQGRVHCAGGKRV